MGTEGHCLRKTRGHMRGWQVAESGEGGEALTWSREVADASGRLTSSGSSTCRTGTCATDGPATCVPCGRDEDLVGRLALYPRVMHIGPKSSRVV